MLYCTVAIQFSFPLLYCTKKKAHAMSNINVNYGWIKLLKMLFIPKKAQSFYIHECFYRCDPINFPKSDFDISCKILRDILML